MVPMMVAIMFVAGLIGDNQYDFGLELWVYAAIGLVLMLATGAAYLYQYNRCFFDVYQESRNVRTGMAEKMRKVPLSFFAKKDPTDLTVRMMGDVTMQETALSHWIPALIASLIFTTAVGVMIVAWSPILGLAIVWPIPVALLMVFLSAGMQKKENRKKIEKMEAVTEMIQESLECSADLKANDAQGSYMEKLGRNLDAVEGAEIRSELTMTIFVVGGQLVLKLGIATTAIAGAVLLSEGSIPLIAYVAALIMVGSIYNPIHIALQNLAAMLLAEDHCERIQEINGMEIQTGSESFEPRNYDIEFKNVGFSYNGGQTVLEDVSFVARQGEVTALVGPSGEGKSTVARLATRFWDVDKGQITLGGIDISTVDPETLMGKYSIVFQDVVLFNTTVMENIRIGRRGASDEEVLAAAEAAMCDEFVSALPEGYGTVIGENGSKLSGGERQRISIARAILKDAPIIIMDEATASLDTESESRVQKALSRLVVDKTVLIIAHRMRTVEEADKIVVLSGGKVGEEGPPSVLRESGGLFERMVKLQTDSDVWSLRGPTAPGVRGRQEGTRDGRRDRRTPQRPSRAAPTRLLESLAVHPHGFDKSRGGHPQRRRRRGKAEGHGAGHRPRQDIRRREPGGHNLRAPLRRLLQDHRRRRHEVPRGHGRGRGQGLGPVHPEPRWDGPHQMEGDAHPRGLRREAAQDHRPVREHGHQDHLLLHALHRGQRPEAGGPCGLGGVVRSVVRELVHRRPHQPRGRTRGPGRRHPGQDC
ncbi:MAG: ABC transporter ATP-binding protein [Candidatus Methanomethylophilaceae archaeon]|nr:ABC transporter ATP-binding protein [Candidatus Methanomethylophilaceae archaeon]